MLFVAAPILNIQVDQRVRGMDYLLYLQQNVISILMDVNIHFGISNAHFIWLLLSSFDKFPYLLNVEYWVSELELVFYF